MLLKRILFSKRAVAGLVLFWIGATGGGAASADEPLRDEAGDLWNRVKVDLSGQRFSALDATFEYEARVKPFNITTHRDVHITCGPHGAYRYASTYTSSESTLCTRISWNGSESVTYFGSSASMPVVDGVFRIEEERIEEPLDLLDGLLFPLAVLDDVEQYAVISYVDHMLLVGVGNSPRLAVHFVSPEVLAYDEIKYFGVDGTLQRTRTVASWSLFGETMLPSAGEDKDEHGEFLLKFRIGSLSIPDLRYESFTLDIPYLDRVLVQLGTRKRAVSATTLDARLLVTKDYRAMFEETKLARAMP